MKTYIKLIFLSILISILHDKSAFAAKIILTQNQKAGLVIVDVMIDTQNQSINALGGNLSFDSSVLGNPSIHTEDSIINNWITVPNVEELHSTNIQSISWAGIIPNGFTGLRDISNQNIKNGRVFRVVFTPLVKKNTHISVEDIDLKANDGFGTTIPIEDAKLSFDIDYPSANIDRVIPINSKNLHVLVGKDKNIFDNKYFISFENSVDSGAIDYYEMTESHLSSLNLLKNPKWRRVTSPAILIDQKRESYVYLRATGRDGSIFYFVIDKEETINSNKSISITKIIFVCVIIIIIIFSLIILHRRYFVLNKINNQ